MIHRLRSGSGAVARGLDGVVAAGLRFVDAFFSGARGVDLALCLISAGWVWAVSHNPETMARIAGAGLSLIDRDQIIVLMSWLALVHFISWINPDARGWRVCWLLVSGGVWAVIGVCFAWGVSTGGSTYLVAAMTSLLAAIYVERRRG